MTTFNDPIPFQSDEKWHIFPLHSLFFFRSASQQMGKSKLLMSKCTVMLEILWICQNLWVVIYNLTNLIRSASVLEFFPYKHMIVFHRLWSARFSTWKIVTLFQIFGDMGICARRTFLPTLHSEDSAGRRFEILLFYWLILCDWQQSNWDGILCQSRVFFSREGYERIRIKSSSLILKTSLKVIHLVESLSYYVRYDWSI